MVRLVVSGWGSDPVAWAAGAEALSERSSTYLELKMGPGRLGPSMQRMWAWCVLGGAFVVTATKGR